MNSKRTFIILTPGFPASEADTTCLPMQQQLTLSMREAYPDLEIIVLTFQYPYHQTPYKWNGIEVVPFGGRNRGGLKKLKLRRKINRALENLNKTTSIAGLLSFWYNECAWIGKKFGEKHRIKHYCWILGQDAKKENKYPRLLRPCSAELIALSDFLQDEFEKNHGVRPKFMIPPGVDEKLFSDNSEEKDVDLLGVGSLITLKQYDIFLEAVAEIKKQIPTLKAVLTGDGPEKERLKSVITQLNLENSITMAGELAYPEVLKLMQRSKLFLHTSSYEGFGCVCIEALQAKAQVISFCKPMKADIPYWHIAKDKKEMVEKSLNIFQGERKQWQSPARFNIRDTCTQIMKLFIGVDK
ncbi:MAG TPA: glycosyltransferase [Chitinophagaceae bacterium]